MSQSFLKEIYAFFNEFDFKKKRSRGGSKQISDKYENNAAVLRFADEYV